MQRCSSGSQNHHTRAVCCPQAVGAPGSEEHPPHRQRGDATWNNLFFSQASMHFDHFSVNRSVCTVHK